MTNSAGIPRALRSAKFWRCCTGDRGASLHPSVSERTTADDAWPSGLRLVPAAAQFPALACQRDIFETPVCFRGVRAALVLTRRVAEGPPPRIDTFVEPMCLFSIFSLFTTTSTPLTPQIKLPRTVLLLCYALKRTRLLYMPRTTLFFKTFSRKTRKRNNSIRSIYLRLISNAIANTINWIAYRQKAFL